MFRFISALALCGALALAGAAAQAQQPPPTPRPAPPVLPPQTASSPDVLLTGCLIQGSGPTVFLIQNAKADPQSTDAGETFLLVAGTEDLNFRAHVDHKVQVSGRPEGKKVPSTAGRPIDEKSLPTLTTKSLTMIASVCTGS
jgi:hypothetical protein